MRKSIKAKTIKPKKTFTEFLKDIHNMTYEQYLELNEYQQRKPPPSLPAGLQGP